MLSNVLILVGACLALANSQPVAESSSRGLQSWTTLTQEAEDTLTALSTPCAANSLQLLKTHQSTALHKFFTCSIEGIVNDIGNIALETGTYLSMSYVEVAKLIYNFVLCPSKLNPLEVLNCFVNEAINAYGPVQDLISSTENFVTDMKTLIPDLELEVKGCVSKGFTEYRHALKSLVQEAKQCQA